MRRIFKERARPQGSIVASSRSMTGMSSLMGYTRLHWLHLSAVPFLTSSTFVLQFGQARISSSSLSTAIIRSGMRVQVWPGGPVMRVGIIVRHMRRILPVFLSLAILSAPAAAAQTAQSAERRANDADAYYLFLLAR